jgi:hypothetical protein
VGPDLDADAPWSISELRRRLIYLLPLGTDEIEPQICWIEWRRRHRERAKRCRYRRLGLRPVPRGGSLNLSNQLRL